MTEYPECEKMALITDKSQVIGEFMEWLQGKYTLCKYDELRFGGTWWPVTLDLQRLLAEFFEIDLDKVEAEKKAILEALQKKQEEPKDWYFTFGHGQPHFGRYCVIRGTCMEAHAEMTRRFGQKWSMQYASAKEAGVDEWNLQELK